MDRSRGTGHARGGPASRRTGARSPPRTGRARGGPAARTWRPCRGDRARRMLDWWFGGSTRDAHPRCGARRAPITASAARGRGCSSCLAGDAVLSKGSPHAGGALGLFCERSGVLKGIPPLCKRYNACKVWYRCENSPLARRPGFRCSRARWFHCGTRILMDGHCTFRVPGADQRRRIPLPGCAGRSGGLAGPAIGAPAATTSGPVPSDRADRPRLMTGPTGRQPHR